MRVKPEEGLTGNKFVEVVGKAIYGVHVQAARSALDDLELPYQHISAALTEARDASDDRTAAIVLFALLDDLSIRLIQRNLDPNVKGGISRLFDGYGFLSTANARMTMAAALRWIDPRTHNELDLLRRIRNEFAHNVAVRSLADDPVAGWLSSMQPTERRFRAGVDAALVLKPDLQVRPLEAYTLRQRLIARGAWLVKQVTFEIPVLPVAQLHQVSPDDVFGDWDATPASFRETQKAVISAVWPILIVDGDMDALDAQVGEVSDSTAFDVGLLASKKSGLDATT
ncbi:MAG: hypothetical protein RLZZ187_2000 [Pseudomonadota bacterium]|jgi:DNA-binding MltR family transcriptional regulator